MGVAGTGPRTGPAMGLGDFPRRGLVVAGATLAVSTLYLWLRYFPLAS